MATLDNNLALSVGPPESPLTTMESIFPGLSCLIIRTFERIANPNKRLFRAKCLKMCYVEPFSHRTRYDPSQAVSQWRTRIRNESMPGTARSGVTVIRSTKYAATLYSSLHDLPKSQITHRFAAEIRGRGFPPGIMDHTSLHAIPYLNFEPHATLRLQVATAACIMHHAPCPLASCLHVA